MSGTGGTSLEGVAPSLTYYHGTYDSPAQLAGRPARPPDCPLKKKKKKKKKKKFFFFFFFFSFSTALGYVVNHPGVGYAMFIGSAVASAIARSAARSSKERIERARQRG